MGKEKGKKGRKDPTSPATKEALTPKQTKSPDSAKVAKKLAAGEKKAAARTAMPTGPIEGFEDPNGRPGPFIQGPPHTKWSSMWKKDMGLIEARIKSLDRQMAAMRLYMQSMPEGSAQRRDYELGERSNWRHICGMMDRARELLCMVKEEARGILPQKYLDMKKTGGVVGMHFERLVPKLDGKAQELGYDPKGKGGPVLSGHKVVDEDGDSEMSDSSDSSSDSDDSPEDDKTTENDDFVSLNTGSNKSRSNAPPQPTVESLSETKDSTSSATDPSPLFFVDTEGSPLPISTVTGKVTTKLQMKKERKTQLAEVRAEKKANRPKAKEEREAAAAAGETKPKSKKRKAMSDEVVEPAQDVDFVALQAQLTADVEKATKAQEDAQEKAEKDKKERRKRRRSSGADADLEIEKEKKVKVEKAEKVKEKSKKRKAEDDVEVSKETATKKVRKHKSAS